jgi:hypothetical protein
MQEIIIKVGSEHYNQKDAPKYVYKECEVEFWGVLNKESHSIRDELPKKFTSFVFPSTSKNSNGLIIACLHDIAFICDKILITGIHPHYKLVLENPKLF